MFSLLSFYHSLPCIESGKFYYSYFQCIIVQQRIRDGISVGSMLCTGSGMNNNSGMLMLFSFYLLEEDEAQRI